MNRNREGASTVESRFPTRDACAQKKWSRAVSFVALAILVATVTVGLMSCAGSGGMASLASGRLTLTITWPEQTRAIPPSTRSLKVQAVTLIKGDLGSKKEDVLVGSTVVARPSGQVTSSISLDKLPSVELRIKVTAHASTDGTSEAIAVGMKDITIIADATTPATIDLQSEVGSVHAEPSSLQLALDQTGSITMTVKKPDGTPVVINESRWSFTSQDTGIATAVKRSSPDGFVADVRGMAQGDTTIRVSDSVTGISTDVPISVSTVGFGCQEYSATLGTQSETSRGTVRLNDPTGSSANATGTFGGTTSLEGISGSARSIDFYKVDAPGISGTIQGVVRYRAVIQDTNPDFPGSAGSVTLTWTGGTQTHSSFGTFDRTFPIILRHGDVIRIEGRASATSGESVGASASYSISIDPLPGDARLITANCQESPQGLLVIARHSSGT
jgi:hypothetical protein